MIRRQNAFLIPLSCLDEKAKECQNCYVFGGGPRKKRLHADGMKAYGNAGA